MTRARYRDLLDYRRRTHTKQADLAAALGVSQSLLSMIENRKRTPTLRLALAIVRRCRVPLTSLLAKEPNA